MWKTMVVKSIKRRHYKRISSSNFQIWKLITFNAIGYNGNCFAKSFLVLFPVFWHQEFYGFYAKAIEQ